MRFRRSLEVLNAAERRRAAFFAAQQPLQMRELGEDGGGLAVNQVPDVEAALPRQMVVTPLHVDGADVPEPEPVLNDPVNLAAPDNVAPIAPVPVAPVVPRQQPPPQPLALDTWTGLTVFVLGVLWRLLIWIVTLACLVYSHPRATVFVAFLIGFVVYDFWTLIAILHRVMVAIRVLIFGSKPLIVSLLEWAWYTPPPPPTPVEQIVQHLGISVETLIVSVAVSFLVGCVVPVVYLLCRRSPQVRVPAATQPEPLETPVTTVAYEPERMVAGSEFMSMPLPAFQVYVQAMVDEVWVNVGCAFRVPAGIVTAHHVIMNTDRLRLVNGKGKSCDVKSSDFDVNTDLGDFALLRELSPVLQGMVTSANFVKVQPPSAMVMATGVGQTSLGLLTPGSHFGMVNYQGSTTRGFSGSAYYLGKNVYGMHLGCGSLNFGYSGSFLKAVLTREEASEDYYLSKLSRGMQHQLQINPSDPDEVIVHMGGAYLKLDKADYDRAMDALDQAADERRFGDAWRADDHDRKAASALRKAAHRSYGKQAGGKLVRMEGGLDLAPPVDFNDSENFLAPPAPACSCQGGATKKIRNVAAPSKDPVPIATTSQSPQPGSQQDTTPRRPEPVQKSDLSLSTLETSLTSALRNPKQKRISLKIFREVLQKVNEQQQSSTL